MSQHLCGWYWVWGSVQHFVGSQFPERSRPSCLSMDDSSDCLAWTDQHEVGKLGLGTVGEQDIVYAPSGRVKVSVPYWAKLKGSLVFLTIEPTVQFMDRQVSLMKAELDAAKQAAEDSCHLVFETQQEAAQKAYDVDPTQQDMSYGSSSDASFVGGKYVGRYADPDEGRGGGGGMGVGLMYLYKLLQPVYAPNIIIISQPSRLYTYTL